MGRESNHDELIRKHTKELFESEQRLKLALRGGDLGLWDINLQTGAAIYDERWAEILGYSLDEIEQTRQMWIDTIYPEDRNRVLAIERDFSSGNLAEYEIEYRAVTKQGKIIFILTRGTAVESDGNGHPLRIVGTITDITRRKQYGIALKNSQQQLSQIINFLPDATMGINSEGEVLFWNRTMEDITGVKAENILGKGDYEYAIPFYGKRRPILIDMVQKWDPAYGNKYHGIQKRGEIYYSETYIPLLCKYLAGTASRLYNAAGEVVGAIQSIRDITAQKHLEAELTMAKEKAEKASVAKSDFLANVSHELRTPLNAIIGFSQILREQAFGELNKKQIRHVTNILEGGRHLLSLIDDILDLSKIEAGKMDLVLSDVMVSELMKESLVMIKEEAGERGITLELSISKEMDGAIIRVDGQKILQIFFNLLSNAIKFTPNGGSIALASWREDREIFFSVTDTGLGIEKEDQERIFNQFEQGQSSSCQKPKGSGLGLPLSKKLVELHEGKIWVESEGEGKGSWFIFNIPIKKGKK